jgi:hypothetical protein
MECPQLAQSNSAQKAARPGYELILADDPLFLEQILRPAEVSVKTKIARIPSSQPGFVVRLKRVYIVAGEIYTLVPTDDISASHHGKAATIE